MKYIYFVSYTDQGGSGHCEVFFNMKITTIEQIREIKEMIQDRAGLTEVIIVNFILLRKEKPNKTKDHL